MIENRELFRIKAWLRFCKLVDSHTVFKQVAMPCSLALVEMLTGLCMKPLWSSSFDMDGLSQKF
jgi:hypothetical protein